MQAKDILGLDTVDNGLQAAMAAFAIDDQIAETVEDFAIPPLEQHFFGNLPHGAEQTVHAGDAALPVDHQNAVAGRFQRRPQLRQGLLQRLLDQALIAPIPGLNEQQRPTVVIDNANRFAGRQQGAIGTPVEPPWPRCQRTGRYAHPPSRRRPATNFRYR